MFTVKEVLAKKSNEIFDQKLIVCKIFQIIEEFSKKIRSFKKQLQVLFLNYADLEEIIKCLKDLLPIMMVKNHNMCQKHIDCSYAHQIAFFMMVDLVNQCKSINGKKKTVYKFIAKNFKELENVKRL